MVPVALADVAVVRMETPFEQLLASGAQGTIQDTDERKAASIRIVDVDFAGDGSRARMLPAVAFAASMRMSDVLITHQRPRVPEVFEHGLAGDLKPQSGRPASTSHLSDHFRHQAEPNRI
jgi:hypothetical protein